MTLEEENLIGFAALDAAPLLIDQIAPLPVATTPARVEPDSITTLPSDTFASLTIDPAAAPLDLIAAAPLALLAPPSAIAVAPSREFRTIDGSGNNLANPSLNTAGSDFARVGPAEFADGIGVPFDGPNTRVISNTVVGQGEADVPNKEGISGYIYAWGQFLDHDLDLNLGDGQRSISVTIPANDPNLPGGTSIVISRGTIDPATGTTTPRAAVNAITGWLDGSQVYGSDAATAASLRSPDGHLLTSLGDNLPLDANGRFMAGDIRVQENPVLTGMQTLFMREHNFQVDRLHALDPTLTGDQLYDQARAIVEAELANITYREFLPALLGPNAVDPYTGYNPAVDPRITHEFAGAAFRFGHSTVSDDIERSKNDGSELAPSLSLADSFSLTAAQFAEGGSFADGNLRALATELARSMDARIVDGLRNFLADGPQTQDLAAINLQRGRDFGLGTLNETRAALGLSPYTTFEQITDDAGTVAALRQAYRFVDNVELWIGGLSERHANGGMIGETFGKIIEQQFERLRDGDRLWFESSAAGLDKATLDMVHATTLSDIILRDTDTEFMQDNAFISTDRRTGLLGGVEPEDADKPQLVIGSPGRDVLLGGPADDTLIARAGSPVLVGQDGVDQFVFTATGTNAIISDFDPVTEKIVFDGIAGSVANVRIADLGGGISQIQLDGISVLLPGVAALTLSASNFEFKT